MCQEKEKRVFVQEWQMRGNDNKLRSREDEGHDGNWNHAGHIKEIRFYPEIMEAKSFTGTKKNHIYFSENHS